MIEVNDEQLKKAVVKYFNAVKERSIKNIESSFNRPIIELFEIFGCKARDLSGERSGNVGENIDIKLYRADDDINRTEPFAAIEVKKIGGRDARAREQIKAEAKRYGNVILTDNVGWEFYVKDNDKMINGFNIIINENGVYKLDENNIDLFIQSIKSFLLSEPVNIKSANRLASYMASYAKDIRMWVSKILTSENSKKNYNETYNELNGLYNHLKRELLPDLTMEYFADMYAKTIVYGLFIARYNDKSLQNFSRGEAITNITKESHLLKQFFNHIATSQNLQPALNHAIDQLCKLFANADLKELLDQTETKDTIIHFYEDFLQFYDLKQRKDFGAYYTPVQVVKHIVGMVDKILTEEFKISGGLSNNDTTTMKIKCDRYQFKKNDWREEKEITVPQVAILDPACGTGTFGSEIIKFIKNKYFPKGREQFYKNWIQDKNGLLSRLIGFEIDMTSYVVAHLKIRRTITETLGSQPDEILPSNIFLTNTLAEPRSVIEKNAQQSFFDFSGAITDEAEQADKWKARRPIKVIIGNPPYLASSKEPFDIEIYKTETDGKTPFGERKHWLNDLYVKFIRFSEQHIEKDGTGVLAFITNNGYLDNPTFRGMRASLLRTFDKIYILNLHGNSNKRETAPDGSKDENVFDIMQGVAIIIGVKTTQSKEWAKVYYSDLFGLRKDKYEILESGSIKYEKLQLDKKMAYFVPFGSGKQSMYDNGIKIIDLFPINVSGLGSGRDKAAITFTRSELESRINIVKNSLNDEPIHKIWGKFTDGQTAEKIRNDILSGNGKITQISYRLFDDRWTYYSGNSCGWLFRPREKTTMGNLLKNANSPIGKNIGLVFCRMAPLDREFSMVFVSDKIIEAIILSPQTSHTAAIAPLYIAPTGLTTEWTPNFNKEHLDKLTQNLKTKPSAIEIFDYCYGVLYDPIYREKYNEFLKRDYPRVPVIEDEAMFTKYKTAGEKLRKLHLMQTETKLDLEIVGNNLKIERPKYANGKLHINKETHIVGIPEAVYNYYIGGYQVLDKWFKSHKGEDLTLDHFNHICKVAGILAETIKIQNDLKNK